MGLFSGEEGDTAVSDARVADAVEHAWGETVTRERLTQTDTTGLVADGIRLNDAPLIDYLDEDEQPHFVFFSNGARKILRAPEIDEELDKSGGWPRVTICLTDRHVHLVQSKKRDTAVAIPLDAVTGCDVRSDGKWHSITVEVDDSDIVEHVFDSFNRSSVTDAGTTLIEVNVGKKYNSRDIEHVESYLNADEIRSRATLQEVRAAAEGTERAADGSPAAIAAELSVDCYRPDERNAGVSHRSGEYPVRLDETSISIGDDEYTVDYEHVSEVRELFHRDEQQNTERTPEDPSASYVTTAAAVAVEGVELVTEDGSHVALYSRAEKQRSKQWHRAPRSASRRKLIADAPQPQFPDEIEDHVRNRITTSGTGPEYVLQGPFDVAPFDAATCELTVEGLADGPFEPKTAAEMDAEQDGDVGSGQTDSSTRFETASGSSIDGAVPGATADRPVTSDVASFEIYEDSLTVRSARRVEIDFVDIDTVSARADDVVVDVGSTTVRIENVANADRIDDAVAFVRARTSDATDAELTAEDA